MLRDDPYFEKDTNGQAQRINREEVLAALPNNGDSPIEGHATRFLDVGPVFMGPYHPSDLNNWTRCPYSLQLKIKGTEEPATSWALILGNVVHQAIDAWHQAGSHEHVDDLPEIANTLMDEAMLDNANIFEGGALSKGQGNDVVMIREALERYVLMYSQKKPQIVWTRTEVPCRTNIENSKGKRIYFEGTIDQLRMMEDETVFLIDVKTGKSQATGLDWWGLRRSYQLWCYAHAVARGEVFMDGEWRRLHTIPKPGILHFRKLQPYKRNCAGGKKGEPRGNVWSEIAVSDEGLDAWEHRALMVVRAIRMGIFPPNPSSCSSCSYDVPCAQSMDLDLTQNETVDALQGVAGINI